MAAERMSGTVKWFSRVKGYGFVAPDGEEREIFVHFTGIEGEGYRNLEKGEKVSFVIEDTDKGPQAVNVRAEGFDVTSWTAEPTDDSGGSETSWRADEEEDAPEPMEESSDEPEHEMVSEAEQEMSEVEQEMSEVEDQMSEVEEEMSEAEEEMSEAEESTDDEFEPGGAEPPDIVA